VRKWNNDPFSKKARREDLLARSAYKLEEMDRRELLLSNARTVIDLGASPGSWTQYCLRHLPQNATMVAVDLSPIKIEDRRLWFHLGSIEDPQFQEKISSLKADLVLSDMAPKTSGVHEADVTKSHELALLALGVARRCLAPKGAFVVKLFMGESFGDFDNTLKIAFSKVTRLRPESTRKHSREIYFIAKGLQDDG
jgi:23S rRNA (uridine2552-2'-O)-methyltransferase